MDAVTHDLSSVGRSADMEILKSRAQAAGALLKALSHENRLLLMCALAERERSVGELEAMLDMRQSAVSQQLARLRYDGLVKTRREGKTIHYSIASVEVRRIIAVLHEIYCPDSARI
jgi:DNA-binding transcriptional ArsR family regulator